MARYLIVANLTAESPTLRDEAARIVVQDPDAVFDVVVPRSGVTPAVRREPGRLSHADAVLT